MGLATKFKPYAGYGKDEAFAPVLFVPGFAQDASSWDDVTAFFRGITRTSVFDHAALAAEAGEAGREVASTVDREAPGDACAGGVRSVAASEGQENDTAEREAGFGFDTVIEALVDTVRALGAEVGTSPVVVGYSLGGRLVLEAIARGVLLPAEVSGVVLESAAAGPDDGAARDALAARNAAWASRVAEIGAPAFMEEWARLPLFASQRELPRHRRDKLAAGRARFTEVQLARQLDGLGQQHQASHDDTVAALTAFLAAIPPTAGDATATDAPALGASTMASSIPAGGDVASLIGNVTAVRIDRPAEAASPRLLYIAGALDTKYTAEGERLMAEVNAAVPSDAPASPAALGELCIIPDAGHNTHFENPMAFSRILYSFLDSLNS